MNLRRRISLIICVVYCVLVVLASVAGCFRPSRKAVYTADSDHVSFMGYDYVSDNTYGFGNIYQIENGTKVKKVYLTRMRSYISGWRIEKMITSVEEGQNGGSIFCLVKGKENQSGYTPYRIVSYSENLGTNAMSPSFFMRGQMMVTGFSYEEGKFYITGVSESRQDMYIYTYDETELISFDGITTAQREKINGQGTELKEISSQRDANGRRYAKAEYAKGTLHTLMDGLDADNYFAEDTASKVLFDRRSESIFKRMVASGVSIIYIITACLIGCVAIVFIVRLFEHRKRVVYRTAIAVAGIVLLGVMFVFLSAAQNHSSAVREFKRNTLNTLAILSANTPADIGTEDFYDSDEFTEFYSKLSAVVESSNDFVTIEDICVVDNASGEIIVSVRGNDGGSAEYTLGKQAYKAILDTDATSNYTELYKGRIYRLISTNIQVSPGYTFLLVGTTLTVPEFVLKYEWGMLIAVVILVVMISLGLAFYIRYDCEIFDRVNAALEKLGDTGEADEMPNNIIGYDMRRIWAGINEIAKNLMKANRATFLTYEAYYRFAPKRIEDILGKETITEVAIGDTRHINGTVAFVITPPDSSIDERSVETRNRFFALAEKHLNGTEGLFVSTESDLSVLRLLFMEDDRNSIRFGTDLAIDACTDPLVYNPTIILHYDSFVYGVAGTENLAYTFLSAEDSDNLEHCARWLGTLGVNMIITEPVKERETGAWDTRYIGFILPDPDNRDRRINLYEVLDATDAESRHNKKRMAADFDSALEMFYEMDFYFARNAFTDILRESPSDEVAKWYLFECERLLNEEASSDFVGELHMDEA